MQNTEEYIRERLFTLQDLKHRDFSAKLIPNVPYDAVIGVRTPDLRKLAKELAGTEQGGEFIRILPHKYHEENCLHAFIIELIKDYDQCLAEVDRFLPYINNWATCDSLSPKAFAKNKERLVAEIKRWLSDGKTYTIRFGIGMLMRYFLDEAFDPIYPEMAAGIRSEEYYVNMMLAWYFATALAKQYDIIIPYLEEKRLSVWVHNKTIRKAIESYRITKEQKDYLRTLTIGHL
ncbi:MAG: DNA alkylation repair protein [Ruminiclostridium sp.]